MNSTTSNPAPRAWWHFPHVWLVVAGPAIVVVASFVTFYLAAKGQDPVLSTEQASSNVSSVQADKGIALAPAMQARNHAATGVLPDKTK